MFKRSFEGRTELSSAMALKHRGTLIRVERIIFFIKWPWKIELAHPRREIELYEVELEYYVKFSEINELEVR